MNYITSIRKFVGTNPIIAPGSAIIVLNHEKKILLQLRSDTGDWGVPGGMMELGESFEETAVRELFEETGLIAKEFELLDVISGEDVYFKYPHGDEVFNATAIYKAINPSGTLKHDRESLKLKYFCLDELPTLNIVSQRILEKINLIKFMIVHKK